MFFPVDEWARAFALTVLVEGVILLPAFRGHGVSWLRLGLLCLFANLATHPVVWFVLTQLFLLGTATYTVVAEAWAVGAEAVLYWAALPSVPLRRVVLVAVGANATSFA
ncbi:MAG TPA: hypothetical protein VIR16_07110, partial [Candidatus Limnocylindrales bacterium]